MPDIGGHLKRAATGATKIAIRIGEDPRLIGSIPIRHLRASSWDLGEPWWNTRAIRYLSEWLAPQARVFEWGSGGSTIWLARKGAEVIAIESNPDWQQRVHDRCPDADVRFIPGSGSGTLRVGQQFYDDYVSAIDRFADGSFDLIVIDGAARHYCAERATTKVRPNGLVVLDDTQRESHALACKPFEGWGRTRIRGFKRPVGAMLGADIYETTFFRRPR